MSHKAGHNAALLCALLACATFVGAGADARAQRKPAAPKRATTTKATKATKATNGRAADKPRAAKAKEAANRKDDAASGKRPSAPAKSSAAPRAHGSPAAGAKAASATRAKAAPAAGAKAAPAASSPAAKSVTVRTEPKASVWLDELRRGVTDAEGRLTINNVRAGRHTLRVRAAGFRERTLPLLPAQRGAVEVKLVPTDDEAELAFQRAEDAREGLASADGTRADPEELYRRAIELRPGFAAAHVGLARVLAAKEDFDAALAEIEEARRARPVYPEASAVEGRILRSAAHSAQAIESYRRAIREARGRQPEAYTGLGIVLTEKGRYEEAIEAFRTALAQLEDTEPAVYQLLGAACEKAERYREAVAAYEKYLALAPEGKLAPAIRSIIDQLRQQAEEQQQ